MAYSDLPRDELRRARDRIAGHLGEAKEMKRRAVGVQDRYDAQRLVDGLKAELNEIDTALRR